jgi:hypothetical protein
MSTIPECAQCGDLISDPPTPVAIPSPLWHNSVNGRAQGFSLSSRPVRMGDPRARRLPRPPRNVATSTAIGAAFMTKPPDVEMV